MTDPFEELRAAIHHDVSRVMLVDADEIEREASRRQRRRHAIAALATVFVLGAAAGWVAIGHRDSAPPVASPSSRPSDAPSRSASPTPSGTVSSPSAEPSSTIPDGAMLQPADVGSGYRSGEMRGDWDLGDAMAIACRGARVSDLKPTHERVQALSRNGPEVVQRVSRYPDGAGHQYLTDVKAAVDNCQSTPGSTTFDVVDEGFAGEESILVEATGRDGDSTVFGFVRQGDVVSQIRVEFAGHDTATRIAAKAAERLCRTTPAC